MKEYRIVVGLRSLIPYLTKIRSAAERQFARAWQWAFPSDREEPFTKHLRSHLLAIIVISLVVAALFHLGWFQGFRSMALDSMLILSNPSPSDSVVIVTVGDDEFASEDLFAGISPLNPVKIGKLLEAVAAGSPKVIGVDLDTSTRTLSEEYQALATMCQGHDWPPVVWSCDACDGIEADVPHDGGHGVPPLILIPPLGGDESALTGIITLPCDPDGVVRRYYRTFHVRRSGHAESELMDSFPWAVVKEYTRKSSSLEDHASTGDDEIHHAESQPEPQELIMNFAGDRFSFFHVTARTVLESHRLGSWTENSPLRDRIVLVGGTYRQARDFYATPIGRVPGVELLAMAIETELRGSAIRMTHEVLAILVDILFGIVFVYLNWRFETPYSMFFNVPLIGILALLGSVLVFKTFGYWLSFAVVLVGIWLHNLLHVARNMSRLHREVHDLRHRLRECQL